MSAGSVSRLLSRTVSVCAGSPAFWTRTSRCRARYNIIAASWRWSPFCTPVHDTGETPAPKTKKQTPRAHGSVGSIGRKIPHRQIQVISSSGENLGVMHRADVIRLMDEEGLKLVALSEHKDPPVYKLMSGKMIHEEQLKQREKMKVKAAPVQVKELSFSHGIGSGDLATKLKQVESWLEKKNHIKITLRSGRSGPAANLDAALEQMAEQLEVPFGFVSRPKVIRDGKAATCIVRLPSAKELAEKAKAESEKSSKAPKSTAPPGDSTDTT
ncbi:translation initiation factor IF-3, mitochondrial [Mugil cephalus]|uniref:translation initiation factor IF-3, mitochondrial n=1 Tax=Mugil cephalus TaxID=48193 RepID=UPI001FB6F6E1|nr:translation initiation factor IF-3, mitochondrial [Mugil cephalus]XP_047429744.1 translation initiation factor IF-3, mitochondrial [Mugil cephalus]